MRKVCVIIIILFQDSVNYTIPTSYSLSMGKPILISSGDLVKFEADSIYLVNKVRFAFYEELRSKLLTLDFDCEHAIDLYKSSLRQNSLIANQLIENSESTNQLNLNFINESQLLLNKHNKTLDLSLANLNSAKENLDLAKNELSKIRTNNLFMNILYTLAGIGVGVIIGISIN